jgi:hypothetical protein
VKSTSALGHTSEKIAHHYAGEARKAAAAEVFEPGEGAASSAVSGFFDQLDAVDMPFNGQVLHCVAKRVADCFQVVRDTSCQTRERLQIAGPPHPPATALIENVASEGRLFVHVAPWAVATGPCLRRAISTGCPKLEGAIGYSSKSMSWS